MTRRPTAIAVLAIAFLPAAHGQGNAPAQPVDFSHKLHAGNLKLPCKTCHSSPDPGETMTIAAVSRCMDCHSSIKAGSPEIRKLAEYAKNGAAVPWVRVYEIPSFVFFSHRVHLQAGNRCEDCHGPVATRDRLFREADLSMAGCMSCHKAKKASLDCGVCHEQPN